jgi:carboxypeptidase A2
VLLGLGLVESKTRYDGYQVWEVSGNRADDLELVAKLRQDGLIMELEGPLMLNKVFSIIVAPKQINVVSVQLRKRNMAVSVIVDNLQTLVEEEEQRLAKNKMTGKAYNPHDFNTLEDNYDHMTAACASPAPGVQCTRENAGNSYEGRPIYVFKIGTGGTKPVLWIDATLHAREWLATTTAVRIFDHLVTNYGSDNEVTDMLNKYDVWLVPVGNPDGYSYTWTNTRLYRKNRRPISGCIGVDLNRNFDFRWCLQGASNNPCDDTYCGPSGGSEPETQAFQNAIASAAQRMFALITLHSYGEMWMHPWGNRVNYSPFNPCERAPDHADMYAAAQAAADGIYESSGRRWDYGTSCEVIYATTGATDDWTKGAQGVKYAFNPELRGTNFIVNPSQIEPSFQEVWKGTVRMAQKIEEIEGPGFPLN